MKKMDLKPLVVLILTLWVFQLVVIGCITTESKYYQYPIVERMD